MTVLDILTEYLSFILPNDMIEKIKNDEYEDDEKCLKELDLALKCYNLVIDEIVSEYMFVYNKKQITSTDGVVDLSDIASNLISIKKVEKNGVKVDFKCDIDTIITAKGDLDITYSYRPAESTLDSEYCLQNTKMPARVVGFGVISEYYLIKGMFDEANVYHSKYKDSMQSVLQHNQIKKMKCRIWG